MLKNTIAIAVYFDDPNEMGYPFDNVNYYKSYQGFSERCAKRDINFVITRGDSYLGNMKFKAGWKYNDDKLEKITKPFTANIIYVKGKNIITSPTDKAVNHLELAKICRDKMLTYQLFSKFMAKTLLINAVNWQAVLQQIPSEKIVVKPVTGMEGVGIVVCNKADFNYDDLDQTQAPFLVQEFVDSSAGIPGLLTGKHDLRLYIFNGRAKIAEYRQPKPGSDLANIAQGGSLTILKMSQVPQWALDFVKQIDQHFKQYFPRIYTIDLMYANHRPYLVELNSRPGLPFKDWGYYDELQNNILDTLLTAL
ncbi:MAG: ATP-grasp domain-containing protein [Patescibacteria group bacterium]|jgi:hypothetical protein